MENILSSSPVWYQTRGCDSGPKGFLAFASRNLVHLLDLKSGLPKHYGVLSGHEDRVTSCSFSPVQLQDDSILLASAGDDCSVKVWSAIPKSLISEHRAHGGNKILAVHWSPACQDLVASGDEKGNVIVWNIQKDSTSKFCPEGSSQNQITCVTFSPHHQHLLAVAYRSGAVSILDINNRGNVFRKLRGHGNDVHSIVWSTFKTEDIFVSQSSDEVEQKRHYPSCPDENDRGSIEGIIATGSKDKTIRLWNLSNGKCVKILKVPSKPSKGRRVTDDSSRLYVALLWLTGSRSQFLSSSYNGDILHWDVTKPDKEQYQVFASDNPDSGHQRIAFNICQGPSDTVVTTSMDRNIKCWSLKAPRSAPVWSLPTLGGFVYSIDVSPVDPSLIALGIGDGVIRIWKTQNPRNHFDMTSLWQGVKEKVMSLAWHPANEGIVAFGTEDGKVGLYDVLTLRPPIISETYHMKAVYSMSWGPACTPGVEGEAPESCLYTCGGEGVILMHRGTKFKGDAVNVNLVIDERNSGHKQARHSEIKWREDGAFLAVGNDNGSFDLYSAPYLQLIVVVKVHSKIINCLAWAPARSNEEPNFLVASGSNGSAVCVSDLRSAVEKYRTEENGLKEERDGKVPLLSDPFRTLTGHSGRITGLAWNPNGPAQLVSASYDGTAQVWDVFEERALANYRGHDGRLLCIRWSSIPVEGGTCGLVYSGGDDYSVHSWRIDGLEHTAPPTECQLTGYTQKNSAQWKRKNKKKKAAVAKKSPPPKTNETQNLTPAIINGASSTDKHQSCVDSDIEMLLERKKAELLADLDTDRTPRAEVHNSSLPGQQQLNPDAEPFTSPLSQGDSPLPPADDPLREALTQLSLSRGEILASKEEEEQHISRRKRTKNLFPLSAALDNKNKESQQLDCVDIVRMRQDVSTQEVISNDRANLGLYGNRKTAYRMLCQEETKLVEAENFDGSYVLKMWRGDIVGAIEEAIERRDLTDQLVALAPMAGYDVWQRASRAFADQLSRDGLHVHASQYLVASHQVREAVTLLRDNRHYREAVGLARARLTDDDPLLIETVRIWAHKLRIGGSHEMAAKCFASIGEFPKAAECISYRSSVKAEMGKEEIQSLFAASALLSSAALGEQASEYGRRALSSVCLRTGMWQQGVAAAQVFGAECAMYRLVIEVHELVISHLDSNLPDDVLNAKEIFSKPTGITRHKTPSEMRPVTDTSLVTCVHSAIANALDHICLSVLTNQLVDLAEVMSSMTSSSVGSPTLKQALYQVSISVLASVLCQAGQTVSSSIKHATKTRHEDGSLPQADSDVTQNFAVASSYVDVIEERVCDKSNPSNALSSISQGPSGANEVVSSSDVDDDSSRSLSNDVISILPRLTHIGNARHLENLHPELCTEIEKVFHNILTSRKLLYDANDLVI